MRKTEMKPGDKFNQLTFIRPVEKGKRRYGCWGLFKCDCGKEHETLMNLAKNGSSKSCGHGRPRPIAEKAGDQFNYLTFIKRLNTRCSAGRLNGLFKCVCGKEIELCLSFVRRGIVKSCGCKHLWRQLPPGEASFNAYFTQYQKAAKFRGHKFSLSKEEFRKITSQNCHYCGAKPSDHGAKSTFNGIYLRNGIDRVKNDEPYIGKNCVPCCKTCNKMKHQLPVDKFISQVVKIYENMNK